MLRKLATVITAVALATVVASCSVGDVQPVREQLESQGFELSLEYSDPSTSVLSENWVDHEGRTVTIVTNIELEEMVIQRVAINNEYAQSDIFVEFWCAPNYPRDVEGTLRSCNDALSAALYSPGYFTQGDDDYLEYVNSGVVAYMRIAE